MAGFINIESLCALLWRPGVALSARQTKRAAFPLFLCERSPFVLKHMRLCDHNKRRLMMSIVRSGVSEELRGLFGRFWSSEGGRSEPVVQQEKPFVTVHFSQRIKPHRSETSKLPEMIHHTGAVICGCHRICFALFFFLVPVLVRSRKNAEP